MHHQSSCVFAALGALTRMWLLEPGISLASFKKFIKASPPVDQVHVEG